MAWRFKASKYKNAAPKIPPKEMWIADIPIGTLGQSYGDHIKSSAAYIAYNTESAGGGSLGILPLSASGRQGLQVSMLLAAGDLVTDFHFSPFDDYLLATGSQDNMVKLWQLPETLDGNISDCLATVTTEDRRIENVLWHPTADGVLAASSHTSVKVFDAGTQQQVFVSDVHKDQVQSLSWHGNGSLLATTCRDKKLRTFDPRAGKLAQEGNGHQNVKESRVMWLGAKDQMITTGFSQMRQREIKLWDTRSLASPLYSLDLDSNTGTLMPFFDPDTNMVFLVGQGDVTVLYMELTDKHPYLTHCSSDRVEQVKGAALVPKRALDVMSGEVNRLLILSQTAIIPCPYIVPRKSYRDFHSDLYPDTAGSEPALLAQEWLAGKDGQVPLVSLNPSKKQAGSSRRGGLLSRTGSAGSSQGSGSQRGGGDAGTATDVQPPAPAASEKAKEEDPSPQQTASERATPPKPTLSNRPKPSLASKPASSPPPSQQQDSSPPPSQQNSAPRSVFRKPEPQPESKPEPESQANAEQESRQTKVFTGVRVSKCRHLKGTVLHRSLHLENIRSLSRSTPGESDMFHANTKRCVLPIEGPGGLLAVLEFDKPGRLPDTGVPVLQNGSKVCDFVWDPFDDSRLVVACDDAKIRVWHIPEGGVTETMTEPSSFLKGHTEKLYLVRFHPMAKDLLVSSAYDMTTRLWNLATGQEVMRLEGHTDQVFSVAWSPNGKRLATVCKDGKIRVYDPRGSTEPVTEGPGPQGSRGARVAWVLGGTHLVVTGFGRGSCRQVSLHSVGELEEGPLSTQELDISPTILVPFYDEDTSTLFLTGRGDETVLTYEVLEEDPYLFPLAHAKLGGLHQALSFLPKTECDVRAVEFARAWRLTNSSVEPISFTVPRVKTEYFQDDLFPETSVTTEPLMSCEDWLKGMNSRFRTVDLQPRAMKPLSEAPVEAPRKKKYESYNPDTFKTDKQKKEELVSAMVSKLDVQTEPLPQEQWEGVDEEEWDDY